MSACAFCNFSKALLSALQDRRAKADSAKSKQPTKTRENTSEKDGTNVGAARAVPCTVAVFLSMFALLLAY